MEDKPTYEELTRRLTELEDIFKALQTHEVDAIVGSRDVLMLRVKEAEENLEKQREGLETLLEERSNLVEELKTHQTELEKQGEELRQSQERAREARDKYLDLYDHAPVGYLTMKNDSFIVEANLTAAKLLGLKKPQLVSSRFNKMIAPGSQDEFYFHVKRLIETGGNDDCELLVTRKDGERFHVQLTSFVMNPGEEEAIIRTTLSDITERKRAEEVRKESEERFRVMANSSPLLIWVHDADGNIQFANLAYEEFFGVTLEQVKGPNWQHLVYPEDAETYISQFFTSLREHRPYHAEARVHRADGEWRWVASVGTPRFSKSGEYVGMVGSSLDITERKKAEEALAAAHSKIQSIIDNTPAILYALDLEGRIVLANKTVAALFGLTPQQMVEKSRYELVSERDAQRYEATDQHVIETGKTVVVEEDMQLEDRSIIWLTTKFPLRDPEGRIYAVAGMSYDITQRKKAEQELEEYRQRLEEMVRERTTQLSEQLKRSSEAEQKVRALSQRLIEIQEKERRELGHALHDEVGGTITALKLALNQARSRHNDDAAPALNELDEMIDELTEQMRFISHSMRPSVLDDYGLIDALQWYLERYEERTGIITSFTSDKLEERLSPQIETASYRIVQEALNNAAKYSGAKSIEVGVSCQNGILAISIKDNGCGFDPVQITSGTGITGMQDLAELTGGSLSVDASPRQGTRVSCELPANVRSSREMRL